jgi:hypothetical protein
MKSKLFAVAVLLLISVSGALGAPINDYIDTLEQTVDRSERVERWTCYDYSVDFENNNPDWDCVTISNHRFFYGRSHMVNYQFYTGAQMIVYDGLLDNLHYVNNWQWDTDYYHFWLDSTPWRNYRYLLDNREVVQ